MEIKPVSDKNQWNDWLKTNSNFPSFTQSWEWGDILISEGKKVERLAVVESGRILAQAQVAYINVLFGWIYAFCPKGPVVNEKDCMKVEAVYGVLFAYFKNNNCIFLRAEPENKIADSKLKMLHLIDINPSATLVLNLNASEEEILKNMHQKTRYNINLAQKKVIRADEKKDFGIFWSLMSETGKRDDFKLHDRGHYEKVLASPLTKQLIAYFENKPIACCVFAGFGNVFTYLYGASSYESRNLMAPHLLQWEGIKMGKRLGHKWYDFFGVAPRCHSEPRTKASSMRGKLDEKSPSLSTNGQRSLTSVWDDDYEYDSKHQYAGVTRFKLGFGGKPYQTPGTWDVVIDNTKYKLYNILRRLRRLI
ncbi:MAG: peptidoglycan bridge formation glycyltransferase FemA/FemB family protein [Patescibacteria group bacterium]